jgi:hypothetical protein
MMSFAFLLAIGAALFTQASTKKFAESYFQANPANKAATCVVVNCIPPGSQTCTLIATGNLGYKSADGEEPCHTQVLLHKIP